MKQIISKIKKRYYYSKEKRSLEKTIIKIKEYLDQKGVRLLFVELPVFNKIKNLTAFEKDRQENWVFDFNNVHNEMDILKSIYDDKITEEYINSVFDGGIVVQGDRRKVLLDFQSANQHIVNGRRITIGTPETFHNTIFTHGACTWRGVGVEDGQTIASFIQKFINGIMPNSYRVVNSAIGRGSTLYDDFEYMKEQQYKPGDIVIVGSHGISQSVKKSFYDHHSISFIETSSLFNRPHNIGEWFLDSVLHTNARGNYSIALKIFEELRKKEWLVNSPLVIDSSKTNDNVDLLHGQKIYGDNPELLNYIKSIETFRRGSKESLNGSIVMNCNPFTLGHRYLIEYAASKVDFLYIFVVEENRSYFDFKDRYELVKKGTEDIHNVVVLPSGNFIISATTFPGYFYKSSLKEARIDCSNDLNVFAEYIAPALNIKVRFAGEEPLDPVTKQYNEGMAEILPLHGIKFCEIPRKKDDEGVGVISASRVRKCLEEGKLEELDNLVPQTTYNYLVERYKREHPDD